MTKGVTHIIVIAVENYHEPSYFPTVDYAKKDAEDLIAAFKLQGFHDDNFIYLSDSKATKTSITQRIKTITARANESDRIILYFSGHGFYEGGENYLAPVDAIKTAIPDTCVSINEILGFFKKSVCSKNILFLDCCHSGFEAGKFIRGSEDSFMTEELIYQFHAEKFCVGFASCKTDQKSISHPKLKNGVWSHYLIKALSGEATGIYTKGLLFSDSLQSYLKIATAEFVKMNTTGKKDQTPIKFGSETDKFIIADFTSIFDERERSRRAADLSFTNISLLSRESDLVKNLPGFKKGFHNIPDHLSSRSESFIKEIGSKIIIDEISSLGDEIRKKLRYKRVDIRSSTDKGGGSIETPDFDYNIVITQSEKDPTEAIITRKLENFKNSNIINSPEFNSVFSHNFDTLEFGLTKRISILKLIDAFEMLDEDSQVKVNYSLSELSSCTIFLEGVDNEIVVTPETLSIKTTYQTSPEKLIISFKTTHKAILSHPELKMLY